MQPKPIPDFKTAEERQDWITQNADYFTVIVDYGSSAPRWRAQMPTLETANLCAKSAADVSRRVAMVYAVYGPYDSWIKNVHPRMKNETSTRTDPRTA